MSVIEYVDKILVYDTGSRDNTVSVVNEIKKKYHDKIVLEEVGDVDIDKFTEVRNEMLARTSADWFLILDGDEVWWNESINKLIDLIAKNKNLESVVSKYYSLAGDIYHYQDKTQGRYKIDNEVGHINIRAMNMAIPGIHFAKPHGQQGVYDEEGNLIQNRSAKARSHMDFLAYLHFTNLKRSGVDSRLVPKRSFKYKYIQGISLPLDFYYPECFFWDRPEIVSSVWKKRNLGYELRAGIEKPLKALKHNFSVFDKSGY